MTDEAEGAGMDEERVIEDAAGEAETSYQEGEWAEASAQVDAIERVYRRAGEQADEAMRCPSCWQSAKVRHCRRCRWLVCRDCALLWNPHLGTYTAMGRSTSEMFEGMDGEENGGGTNG